MQIFKQKITFFLHFTSFYHLPATACISFTTGEQENKKIKFCVNCH